MKDDENENPVLNTKYGRAKIDNKGYYKITSSKEGNVGKFLHRVIYEDETGEKIPEGYVVHHKDGNKLNNDIDNLELKTRADHNYHHHKGNKYTKEARKKMSDSHKGKMTGDKNPQWKGYARVVKNGITHNGKQLYSLIDKEGKVIKSSIYKEKLQKEVEKLNRR